MAHKTLMGTVTSDSRDKTITVTVTSRETHPLYGKQYTRNRKYQAHDEKNEAGLGDRVTIIETTPISKTKSFVLHKIEERSKGSIEIVDDAAAAEELVAPDEKADEPKEDE